MSDSGRGMPTYYLPTIKISLCDDSSKDKQDTPNSPATRMHNYVERLLLFDLSDSRLGWTMVVCGVPFFLRCIIRALPKDLILVCLLADTCRAWSVQVCAGVVRGTRLAPEALRRSLARPDLPRSGSGVSNGGFRASPSRVRVLRTRSGSPGPPS